MGAKFDFHFTPSVGHSVGNLGFIWNSSRVSNCMVSNGNMWVCLNCHWGSHWLRLVLAYAPNSAAERESFWLEIKPLFEFEGMVFYFGDFNEVRFPKE